MIVSVKRAIDDAGSCLCETVARKDVAFLKRVLMFGTNPNSKNYDRRTPLHIAAAEALHPIVRVHPVVLTGTGIEDAICKKIVAKVGLLLLRIQGNQVTTDKHPCRCI